jgi:putative oxidoreductase
MTELIFSLFQYNDFALFLLRLSVGAVFLLHGISKLSMWKMQPSNEMPANMLSTMKILSIAEPLGGIGLLFGVLTRFAALGLAIIMAGAIYLKIAKWNKKFMDGWEFDFVLLCANLALFLMGPGTWSIDSLLFGSMF